MTRSPRRIVALALLSLAGAAFLLVNRFAAADVGGHPAFDPKTEFKGGEKLGVEVWTNEFGWMLRASSKLGGAKHRITGRIQVTGGKFQDVSGVSKDEKDAVKVSPDKDTIEFSFNNGGGVDGVNFKVSKAATKLVFTVNIDGKTQLDKILIGPRTRPTENPFMLRAQLK